MRRTVLDDEEGSILPLVLGYAVLAIALVLVCANATALYLAQKRLDALADAAALAASDGFTLTLEGDAPRAELDDERIRTQAQAIVDAAPGDPALVAATTNDGVSVTVTVTSAWSPAVLAPFVPDGVALRSTATSRNALD
ncbi:pilus assembly protein TadG-related protein [Microbacterium sp. JZ31]|uniref:pilus assembly protein TadG-related protein n=1 Tax=Microbacterium sp. JZ31 TaxID=1906274 RepID=UPI0019336F9E|nr:pilus assembly protein TadG-related protein [Microbacterium sp. JZ31]